MGVVIMTNPQLGTSSFERNGTFTYDCRWKQFPSCGILNSRRPIFGVGLKSKNVKDIRILVLRKLRCGKIYAMSKEDSDKRLVGGGVLEKEFEFKPSFDGYLKAMESVKTGRETKQAHKSNRFNSRDDDSRGKDVSGQPLLGRDEEDASGAVETGRETKQAYKSNRFNYKDESRRKDVSRTPSFGRDDEDDMESAKTVRETKQAYKSSRFSSKDASRGKDVSRTPLLRRVDDNAMESVMTDWERKQGHKSSRFSSKDASRETYVSRTLTLTSRRGDEDAKLRKFEGPSDEEMVFKDVKLEKLRGNVNGVIEREGVFKGKFVRKESVNRMSKDKLNDNGSRVDAMKRKPRETTDGRWLRYQNNDEKPELKGSYLDKGLKFKNARDNPDVFNVRSGGTVDVRGKLVHDKNSIEMSGTRWKSFDREEEVGVRSTETRGDTLVRNLTQGQKATDREIEQKGRKLIGSRKSFLEAGDDNNVEVERAAFNTFEGGNDMDKPRVSRMEMEERIQRLARQLNGADINVPEWMFSKTMRSARIRFSDHSILRVIQILGKLGNWRRVVQVIEWLQSRERFKSSGLRYVYTAALTALGKAKRPVEALNVFHAMQQQMSSYPDLVAYHCIAVTLGQAGHIKELFDVIDIMRSPPKKKFKTGALRSWDPRLEPDIVVYNAVLNACVKRKQWEGAFWVLQQLKTQGQKPSATTYGLVMEVMFACGKYNLVHEFFRKVQKSYIPNALIYKVLVNTLWREGKTDEAVLAVQNMERRGIIGSAALYYDLARCLCSAGRCEEALMQIENICKVANKPLVVTYTGLIQACLDSGNIQNAAYIFNQMKDFCSPNLVTCNIMLKAYLEHGSFEEAMKLFQKMAEDSNHLSSQSDYRCTVIPDIYTFNTMLDACIVDKRWDDLEHVYKRMLQHGYHFNAKRHLRMILDASRAGKVELLETTWKHLVRTDRIPPPPLIKERFCINLQKDKDDYVSALSCITSHRLTELPELSKNAWLNLFIENSHQFDNDTLVRLTHEANMIATRNESPNLVLQNMLSSCKEFLRARARAPETEM